MATSPTQRTYNKRKKEVQAPESDEFGNLQPQALELEQAILGAMMLEREAYDLVSDILRPECFYDTRHQRIYEAVRSLSLAQTPVDILTVKNKLEQMGALEEVGGPYYISQLAGMMASSAHIETHARIVAQKHLQREIIAYSARLQRLGFDPTQDVDELIQEAESQLFAISQTNMKKDYTQVNPVIKEAYEMLERAAAQTSGISGVESGFHKLDAMTSGWQKSDLIILAARPAMGKTAFALSMLKNMAVDYGTPVAFFSLEMGNVQLVNRLISNVCSIEGSKIRSGQLENHEWGQLDKEIKRLNDTPIYLDDTPSLSIFELRTKARRLVREHNVGIIMIDYLQLMNAGGMTKGNRQEEVSAISRSLKALARELRIPIIALSQLNRGVENREGNEGKRPQLSDLRESGAIEQDADMVVFIHRPEYYHIYDDGKGNSYKGMAEIIIAKHRNGSVGDVLLSFKGKYVRFENPEDSAYAGASAFEMTAPPTAHSADANMPPPPMDAGTPFPSIPTNIDVPF